MWWFILSLLISSINDLIVKYLNLRLSPIEISFYRAFLGTTTLIPIVLYQGRESIKTSKLTFHFIRGILLGLAISLWTQGLKSSQLIVATIVSFTIPIFVLILATFFLKERVTPKLWILTFLGMIGVIITTAPYNIDITDGSYTFIIASMLFAILDVINKKYIIQETMLCMLFYSSLFTTIFLFIPLNFELIVVPTTELILLIPLAINSNAILFCILKAFRLVSVSRLASLRYLELLFSGTLGYVIFHDEPNSHIFIGALIIIPTSFYIASRRNI